MLVRLIYASRSTTHHQRTGAADSGCRPSAQPLRGITGVLCYGDGVFVQALEGGGPK
jgi:hypothetical protein